MAGSRPALAQSTPFAKALEPVGPGQTIWVTTTEGRVVEGRVGSILDAGLNLVTRTGDEMIAADRILKVEKADGLRDGVMKGLLIGALAVGGTAAAYIATASECPCDDGDAIVMRFIAAGAGIGAAAGAAVDGMLHRRHTLYRTSPGVALAPVVAPGRLALGASLRW